MAIVFTRRRKSNEQRDQKKAVPSEREGRLSEFCRSNPTRGRSNLTSPPVSQAVSATLTQLRDATVDMKPSMLIDPGDSDDSETVLFCLRKRREDSYMIPRRPSFSETYNNETGRKSISTDQDFETTKRRCVRRERSFDSNSECSSSSGVVPSPRSVITGLPSLGQSRTRSLSGGSHSELSDKSVGGVPDLPDFLPSDETHPLPATVRRARKRYAIPLPSFGDDGLRLLLQMHAELRVVTAEAQRERRVRVEVVTRTPSCRNLVIKQKHNDLMMTLDSEAFPKAVVVEQKVELILVADCKSETPPTSRINGQDATTVLQAMIEDREEECLKPLRRSGMRFFRRRNKQRLGTRVRRAIQTLGFY